MAALTVESNDSISTVWRDSGWLHDVGTSQVSHFAFLRYFGVDVLDPDLHRFDLNPTMSTAGPMDPTGMFRNVSGWLRCTGASAVSCFDSSRLADVSRFDLDPSASPSTCNESVRTV